MHGERHRADKQATDEQRDHDATRATGLATFQCSVLHAGHSLTVSFLGCHCLPHRLHVNRVPNEIFIYVSSPSPLALSTTKCTYEYLDSSGRFNALRA